MSFGQLKSSHSMKPENSPGPHSCSLEMPKDELPNHNCIKHLRSVVQQQQTKISELEKTVAEHKHQLGEQVGPFSSMLILAVVCKTGFERVNRIYIFNCSHFIFSVVSSTSSYFYGLWDVIA